MTSVAELQEQARQAFGRTEQHEGDPAVRVVERQEDMVVAWSTDVRAVLLPRRYPDDVRRELENIPIEKYADGSGQNRNAFGNPKYLYVPPAIAADAASLTARFCEACGYEQEDINNRVFSHCYKKRNPDYDLPKEEGILPHIDEGYFLRLIIPYTLDRDLGTEGYRGDWSKEAIAALQEELFRHPASEWGRLKIEPNGWRMDPEWVMLLKGLHEERYAEGHKPLFHSAPANKKIDPKKPHAFRLVHAMGVSE